MQLDVDLVRVAAQRHLALPGRIVGVLGRGRADRRLGLHGHVRLVVLDVEQRLRGVLDPPDHHRGDLDRVAALVVDLQLGAVEVARAQRHVAVGRNGLIQ